MSESLRNRWIRLWRDAALQGECDTWFEVLTGHYGENHRHYHTLRHIEECLDEFSPVRRTAAHPAYVELAIWFHDAIYDTHSHDNEEQSALLAEQCLSESRASAEMRLAVRDLVMATKSHDASRHLDAPLLVDVDLSILGKRPARFQEYESQIRQEYSWVPEEMFATRRAEILQQFLSRPRIFSTDWFFRTHETPARKNLKASLEQLRQVDR